MDNNIARITLWRTSALNSCVQPLHVLRDRHAVPVSSPATAPILLNGVSGTYFVPLTVDVFGINGRSVPIWRERPFDRLI